MPSVHTHYDNLKVYRTASSAEIRMAYKKLVQKHHPDKFTDASEKAKATKITHLLNTAYTVLSDDKKRAAHDYWISKEEAPKPTQKPSTPQSSKGFYNTRPETWSRVNPKTGERQTFRKKSPLEPEDRFDFTRNADIFTWGYYRDACLRQLEVDWVYWDSKKLFKENRLLDRKKIQDSLYSIQNTIRYLYENTSIPPSSIRRFCKDNKVICYGLLRELAYLKSQKDLADKLAKSPWKRRAVNILTETVGSGVGLKLAKTGYYSSNSHSAAVLAGICTGSAVLLSVYILLS